MRRPGLGLAVLALLGACNQILGNDDGHHLVADVAPSGGSSGASGGSAGSSAQGGKTNGTGGKMSSSGAQNAGGGGVSANAGSNNGEAGEQGGENCDAPATCVAVPDGASLGYFAGMGEACDADYVPVTLHQGLNAPVECTGCSCTPSTADCDAGFYGQTPAQCPGFGMTGLLYNVFSSSCQPVSPNSTRLLYYSVRGLAECTPTGVAVPTPAAWTTTGTFCELQSPKGCASGSVCAPPGAANTAPNCTRLANDQACTAALGVAMGDAWSTGFSDERTCVCQCSFGISTCGNAHIQVFPQANCAGGGFDLGNGTDGNNCNVPFIPQSGRITGGVPGTNQCPVNSFPVGEVTADDRTTICCH